MKCSTCGKDYRKNKKGYEIRRLYNGVRMCTSCYNAAKTKEKFLKKHTKDIDYKMECDVCHKDTIAKKRANGEFICADCKRKNHNLGYKPSENELRRREEMKILLRERVKYLKSLKPEELIAIVMEDNDEMQEM